MTWDNIKPLYDFGKEQDDIYAAQPTVFSANAIDPDRRAKALILQKENSMPVEVIESDLPAYEAESRFKKFDLQQYADTPVTMSGLYHPEESPIYLDDAENLSAWERFFGGISSSWASGKRQVALRDINKRKFHGNATADDLAMEKAIEAQDRKYRTGGNFENWFAQIPAKVAEMAPLYLNALAESYDETFAGGAAGIAAMGPAGAAPGLALGAGYGTIIEMGKTEAYLAYADLVKMKDSSGKPIDENAARGAAAVVGLINGAVEYGGAKILGKFTGIDRVASLFARRGLRELLKLPSAQKTFARIGLVLSAGAAENGAEEAIQQGVNLIVGENLAAALNKSLAPLLLTPQEEVAKQVLEAGKGGAQVGIAFSGPQAATIALADSMRTRALNRNAEMTRYLAGLVEKSKTFQRMPQKWRDHVAAVKEEYGVTENVTVPFDVLQTFFQESGVTTKVLEQEAPGIARAVAAASQSRADVSIPVEDYATFLARSEAFQPFVQDVRMHPELPTDREMAELQQTIKDVAATIEPKDQTVYENFRAKLIEAESPEVADFQARLLGSFFETQAAGMGITAGELYDRYKVDIERDFGGSPGENKGKGRNLEISETMVREPKNTLYQSEQDPRGFISMNNARDYFKITLTGKADLSTMLHESGHLFLEIMQDLARKPESAGRAAKDMQVIRDWMKLDTGAEITREHHEKFAKGFESWLMEGKAPSEELKGAFRRFSAWLKSIYHEVTALGVELSPEIRQVFSRMVATEEAINRTAEIDRLLPTFQSAEQAGMTAEEWGGYVADWAKGMEEAEETMLGKIMGEITAHEKQQNRKIAAQIRSEVEKDVRSRPVYQALHFLKTGNMLDGSDVPKALGKLDRAIVESLAPGIKSTEQLRGLTVKEGGVHPVVVSSFFGFENSEAMIKALAEAPTEKQAIAAETSERYKSVFGDSMEQPSDIPRVARQALHNDRIAEMMVRELRIFGKKTGRPIPAGMEKAARLHAEMEIDNTAIGDLSPHRFEQAERRYGKQAFDAAARNDWVAAADAKRLQIVNHWLARKAAAAKEEADSIRNYLHKFEAPEKRKKLGLAGGSYLESIDILLEGVQLSKVSGVEIGRRRSLESYLKAMEDAGQIVQIPDELRSEIGLKNYREMKVAEFRSLRDAVKNIDHLARLKNKLLLGKQERDFTAAMDSMVAKIFENAGTIKTSTRQNPSGWDKLKSKLRGFDADLLKVEFLIEQLDGAAGGLIHELIFEPMAKAQARKYDMLKDINRRLYEPLRKMPKEQKARMAAEYNFLGTTMKGHEVLAVALNTGNEGNLQKLIQGYQERGWTEESLQTELDRILTAEDWALVQHIWNEVGSFWPEIAALNKKYTGLEPPKVEPRKVVSAHGEFDGGYYPVVYDPSRKHRSFVNAQKGSDMFENNFMRPGVGSGFTEARTSYSAPILLSLDALPSHINEVLHYLTHYEAVTQAARIIEDQRFRNAVTEAVGQEYYHGLRPWLQAIAKDGKTDAESTWIEGFIRHTTMGLSIMSMGFSTSTGLIQVLGLSSSLSRIGPKWLVSGLKSFAAKDQRQFAMEHSNELRHAMQTFDRDARASYNEMLSMVAGDVVAKAKYRHAQIVNFAFWTMGALQQQVDTVTWLGAYNQACADGKANAVEIADTAVRLTQSGGGIKDMAKIQRHSPLRKMFTAFYTYFSALYGQLRQAGRRMPQDPIIGAAQIASLVLLPVLIEKLMRGGLPDDDEPADEWMKSYLSGVASFGLATLPVARDLIQPLLTDFGYAMSPGASVIDRGIQSFEAAAKSDGELTPAQVKNMARMIGLATHLPATQAIRAWEYFDALFDGEVEEPVREFIFGVKRK